MTTVNSAESPKGPSANKSHNILVLNPLRTPGRASVRLETLWPKLLRSLSSQEDQVLRSGSGGRSGRRHEELLPPLPKGTSARPEGED